MKMYLCSFVMMEKVVDQVEVPQVRYFSIVFFVPVFSFKAINIYILPDFVCLEPDM